MALPLLFRRALSTRSTAQLAHASKVVCIGRNYADHIKELNNKPSKAPFFFLKPPSAILLPGQGPVVRPRGVVMHYEVELALVLGKRIKDLDPADTVAAMDAIDGEGWLHFPLARVLRQ